MREDFSEPYLKLRAGAKRSAPGAAIDKVFCNDMHDALLMLQPSTHFEELRLEKRSSIFLGNGAPNDDIDDPSLVFDRHERVLWAVPEALSNEHQARDTHVSLSFQVTELLCALDPPTLEPLA
jgi:hypothetical protein